MSHTASVSLCVLGGSYVEAAADDLLVRATEDNLLVGLLFALVHVAYVYPKQTHPPTQPSLPPKAVLLMWWVRMRKEVNKSGWGPWMSSQHGLWKLMV
jgi:hypothetical protein